MTNKALLSLLLLVNSSIHCFYYSNSKLKRANEIKLTASCPARYVVIKMKMLVSPHLASEAWVLQEVTDCSWAADVCCNCFLQRLQGQLSTSESAASLMKACLVRFRSGGQWRPPSISPPGSCTWSTCTSCTITPPGWRQVRLATHTHTHTQTHTDTHANMHSLMLTAHICLWVLFSRRVW